ncbi:MAG TPA: class I SAM-dependent methyltransferase [bacterium]|nr:class I SAM-dependent methyltransferase [bacterium]
MPALPPPRFLTRYFPGFSKKDLSALQDYYQSQLKGHATPEKRVGWQTAHSQRVRFEALACVGDLRGKTILDVGCGLGGFYAYLRDRRLGVRYRGVDLFPPVIAEAKEAHPGARFEARNIYERPFPRGAFEYAFFSGVFNVRVKDNWRYLRALLKGALGQVRKGLAFNVLNAEAGLKESDRFFVHPKELAAFGRRLGGSRVRLLDHYHHLDLTLHIYK